MRLTGFAPRTIQIVVDELVADGILTDRREGNRRYFRANSRHPFFLPLRDLLLRSEGLVDVLAEALGESGIERALVFGSMAEGTAVAESDVDMLIVGEIGLKEAVRRLTGVTDILGREINPIVWTRDEYERRKASQDHFLTMVREGKTLYFVGEPDESG